MHVSWVIARVSDLGPGEFLEAHCVCGHVGRWLPPDLPPGAKEDDVLYVIEMRLRCVCGARGGGKVKLHVIDGKG